MLRIAADAKRISGRRAPQNAVRKEEIIYHLITADMEEELVREISEDYQAYNKDAARDIYQMTNTMPDYILSVLKNQFARNGITDALIDFLNYYINNVSDLSKNSLGSIERELVRLDHISAWLKDTMPHHENNELYLRLQYSYIWICLANGRHNMEKHTDEAYAEALKFYDIAINLAKELYDTDPSSFATMELGIAFYEKAIILGRLGGKANEEKAIEMNRNACKMAQISIKKQGYVSYSDLRNYILFNRSLVNELIDKHNEAHTLEALKLLQAAIVTVNGLLDEQNMPLEILAEYAKLYHSLGNCYSNIDNTDFINKGIDSYKKGFNLTKQCYLAMGNKEHLYDISVSCISLAKAYRKAGNKESLMKGFAYAEDAVKYSKRGLFEYNLADYIHLYGKALSLYAELAGEIGDPSLLVKGKESLNEAFGLISEDSGVPVIERIFLIEDLIRGITWISAESQDKDYLKKALSLAASIKAKYDAEYIKNNYDSKLAHSLSDIYDVAASACQTLGDLKTIEKGIEFATESLEITKIIIESEENSIFLQRYLELSLLKMGTLMGAAGKDIDEILHYMEQGLAIAEKLAVLSDTYEKQSDYGFALMRNAEALLLKNDKDLLIKAQEYVSKAIEIRTKLLEQRNTAHQYEELINSYLTSSSICLRLGDESNAKSVLDKSACVLKEAVDKGSTPKLQIGQGDYEVSFAEFLEQTGKLEESIK